MAITHEETRGRDFKYPKWMIEAVCVAVVVEGKSQKEMAKKYDIPPSTIHYWVAAYKKKNAPSVTADEADFHTEGSVSKLSPDSTTNEPSAQGVANTQTQEG